MIKTDGLGYTIHPGNEHNSQTFPYIYEKLKKFGVKTIVADAGYKTPAIARLLLEDGITPVFPYKRPMTKEGFFKKYEYVYDKYYDCYICPNNQILKYSTTNRDGYRECKSSTCQCGSCPYLSQCTESKDHVKVVTRHVWEAYMEQCEEIRHTRGSKKIYDRRKETIERIFGTAKEQHGMRYTHYKGKTKMEMKVGLTFAYMNLKKLARRIGNIYLKIMQKSNIISDEVEKVMRRKKMKKILKKRIIIYFLALIMCFSSHGYVYADSSSKRSVENSGSTMSSEVQEEISEIAGDGTKDNPYVITNASQLENMNNNLSDYYKLTNDIDLNGAEWMPVGTSSNPFTGHLDGNGYKISNFIVNRAGENYAGLFGATTNAEITNLTLSGFTVTGAWFAGGLIGCQMGADSILENCHVEDGTVEGQYNVGGLVGEADGTMTGTMKQCSSSVIVRATNAWAGGLAGSYYKGNMYQCYFTGKVTMTTDGQDVGGLTGYAETANYSQCFSTGEIDAVDSYYVAGLVGMLQGKGNMEDCYSVGSIKGKNCVAGLIGLTYYLDNKIKNCYSAAKISGIESVSGLYNLRATIINSYYDAEASSIINNTPYDIDRQTTTMVSSATYKEWNFDTIWSIEEELSYPYLRYASKPEEVIVQHLSIEGKGTQSNPYLIKNAEELNLMRYHISSYYKLMNDIDLNGAEWIPVGTSDNPFAGYLDGNGYKISNFVVNRKNENYAGLFGATANAGITNLTLSGFTVTGAWFAGGLIGCQMGADSILENCHVEDGTVEGQYNVGGLVGEADGTMTGTMKQCSSSVIVRATNAWAGGLAGSYYKGNMYQCYFTGKVTMTAGGEDIGGLTGYAQTANYSQCFSTGEIDAVDSYYVAGLVGMLQGKGNMEDCYSVGSIKGKNCVAGLIGLTYYSDNKIKNCYSAAKISGIESVNGLYNLRGTIVNSYYDKYACGLKATDIYGRRTAVMVHQKNFTDWDFSQIWCIEEGVTYPYLIFAQKPSMVVADIVETTGRTISERTGAPIQGLTVNIRTGKDNKDGDIIDTVITEEDGTFVVDNLSSGTYTGEVVGEKYETKYFEFICEGKKNNIGDIPVMTILADNEMEAVLTWGAVPTDLDTYFSGNNKTYFYGNLYEGYPDETKASESSICLESDSIVANGRESLHVRLDKLEAGTYQYRVHWYHSDEAGDWADSEAKVKILIGKQKYEMSVPITLSQKSINDWNVFTLNTKDKTITFGDTGQVVSYEY